MKKNLMVIMKKKLKKQINLKNHKNLKNLKPQQNHKNTMIIIAQPKNLIRLIFLKKVITYPQKILTHFNNHHKDNL